MFIDVIRWSLLFVIVLLAFTSAQYVLYREQAAGIGPYFNEMFDACDNLDQEMSKWHRAFYLLFEMVLTGEGHLECFRQSSIARRGMGTTLQYIFLTYTVILMLNFLIALMGQSFQTISERSNSMWKLLYAKLVFEWQREPACLPPLNLWRVAVPLVSFMADKTCSCVPKTVRDRMRAGAAPVSDKSDEDPLTRTRSISGSPNRKKRLLNRILTIQNRKHNTGWGNQALDDFFFVTPGTSRSRAGSNASIPGSQSDHSSEKRVIEERYDWQTNVEAAFEKQGADETDQRKFTRPSKKQQERIFKLTEAIMEHVGAKQNIEMKIEEFQKNVEGRFEELGFMMMMMMKEPLAMQGDGITKDDLRNKLLDMKKKYTWWE